MINSGGRPLTIQQKVEYLLKSVSCLQNNAILQETLNTFADLQNYKFSNKPVRFDILNDEDKDQENTAYFWNGTILKWSAEVEDDFQPVTS